MDRYQKEHGFRHHEHPAVRAGVQHAGRALPQLLLAVLDDVVRPHHVALHAHHHRLYVFRGAGTSAASAASLRTAPPYIPPPSRLPPATTAATPRRPETAFTDLDDGWLTDPFSLAGL